MSDIGLPPGMGIFLVSLGLAALALFLALVFLIAGLLSQKTLRFSRRRASCLLFGMAIPVAVAGLGLLAANEGPSDLLYASDRMHPAWLVGPALVSVVLGIAWGTTRYSKFQRTTS